MLFIHSAINTSIQFHSRPSERSEKKQKKPAANKNRVNIRQWGTLGRRNHFIYCHKSIDIVPSVHKKKPANWTHLPDGRAASKRGAYPMSVGALIFTQFSPQDDVVFLRETTAFKTNWSNVIYVRVRVWLVRRWFGMKYPPLFLYSISVSDKPNECRWFMPFH